MAELSPLKVKINDCLNSKALTPWAKIPKSDHSPKSSSRVFSKKPHLEKLNNAEWDADNSEVTDEASPNSIERYKCKNPCVSGKNVLVENKGNVKNLNEFKIELQSYPSCRVPMIKPHLNMPKRKGQLRLSQIRGYKTNIDPPKEAKAGKSPSINDIFNFQSWRKEDDQKHLKDSVANWDSFGDRRKIFRQARSVSRKISSSKLLHMLMKNSFDS